MGYFAGFDNVRYKFGEEDNAFSIFQNISSYADIVDKFKDSFQHYLNYEILEGDRPDVLSAKMYGDQKYYWTFYLMNDHLRRQGWPLTYRNIKSQLDQSYPNTVLNFRTDDNGVPHIGNPTGTSNLINIFKVGSLVEGTQSGATGTVIRKKLDLGQIIISGSVGSWIPGETVKFDRIIANPLALLDPGSIIPYPDITLFENARLHSSSLEINASHHHEDADGNWVDINPLSENQSAFITEVTYSQHLQNENNKLRKIKVLKPSVIRTVHRAFIENIGR
jgi:hypothetical protein